MSVAIPAPKGQATGEQTRTPRQAGGLNPGAPGLAPINDNGAGGPYTFLLKSRRGDKQNQLTIYFAIGEPSVLTIY